MIVLSSTRGAKYHVNKISWRSWLNYEKFLEFLGITMSLDLLLSLVASSILISKV